MSFNLLTGTPNATNPTPLASTTADDWGFSAVYPDGSRILTAGEPQDSTAVTPLFPFNNDNNNPAMIGPKNNVMYNPYDAGTIPFSGLADKTAMMPMFSPDGAKIVFNDVTNHWRTRAEVVQDFDAKTNTFSNPVVIYNDANGNYPGWPFFTPDNEYVVFAMGKGPTSQSIPPASFQRRRSGAGVGARTSQPATSTSRASARLGRQRPTTDTRQRASGRGSPATSYLPYPGRDEHLNFYPTGKPGGSGWLFLGLLHQPPSVRQRDGRHDQQRRRAGSRLPRGDEEDLGDAADDRRERMVRVRKTPATPAFFVLPGQGARERQHPRVCRARTLHQDGRRVPDRHRLLRGFCTNGRLRPPADVLEAGRQVQLHPAVLLGRDPCPAVHRRVLRAAGPTNVDRATGGTSMTRTREGYRIFILSIGYALTRGECASGATKFDLHSFGGGDGGASYKASAGGNDASPTDPGAGPSGGLSGVGANGTSGDADDGGSERRDDLEQLQGRALRRPGLPDSGPASSIGVSCTPIQRGPDPTSDSAAAPGPTRRCRTRRTRACA